MIWSMLTFTFNVQVDWIADTVSFGIVGRACVNSRICTRDFLQNEALIRNDDFFLHIMR